MWPKLAMFVAMMDFSCSYSVAKIEFDLGQDWIFCGHNNWLCLWLRFAMIVAKIGYVCGQDLPLLWPR